MRALVILAAALALSGCIVVNLPPRAGQVLRAPSLANPCGTVNCDRPNTSRIA